MFSRLGKFLIVAALVISTGTHWVALQSIAWVGMALNYSRTQPFLQALEQTFDGQHPCRLCKVVAAGREQERQPGQARALPSAPKLELILMTGALRVEPQPPVPAFFASVLIPPSRGETPPVPPPRAA